MSILRRTFAINEVPHALVILLVILPFLALFRGHEGIESVVPLIPNYILNYGAILLAVVLFHRCVGRIRPDVLGIVVLFALTYLINFMANPHANPKLLLNSLGFMFVFLSVAAAILRLSDTSRMAIEKKFDSAVFVILVCLSLIFLATIVANASSILDFFLGGTHNNSMWLLTTHFTVSKQALGNLLILLVMWCLCSWGSLSARRKRLFVACIILGFPFWIAIRTFYFSLAFLAITLFVFRTRQLITRYLVICLSVVGGVFVVGYRSTIYEHVDKYYNRLPGMLFAVDTLKEHPMGLGNGAYHVFVDNNYDVLAREYLYGGRRKFARAPESDLTYFVWSFGVLSVVFFGFYVHLLYRCARILLKCPLSRLEKFLILASLTIMFAGFGQDNAGGLLWWVYMAAGFATSLRYSDRPSFERTHIPTHTEMLTRETSIVG